MESEHALIAQPKRNTATEAAICGLWAAFVLVSCDEGRTCREILCGSEVTVKLTNPISEDYDLSVRVRDRELVARCPGSTMGQQFSIVLGCDANGFTLRGKDLFQDVGAPRDIEVVVSSIKTSDRQIADNLLLKAKLTGSNDPGCEQRCYRGAALLDIPSI